VVRASPRAMHIIVHAATNPINRNGARLSHRSMERSSAGTLRQGPLPDHRSLTYSGNSEGTAIRKINRLVVTGPS